MKAGDNCFWIDSWMNIEHEMAQFILMKFIRQKVERAYQRVNYYMQYIFGLRNQFFFSFKYFWELFVRSKKWLNRAIQFDTSQNRMSSFRFNEHFRNPFETNFRLIGKMGSYNGVRATEKLTAHYMRVWIGWNAFDALIWSNLKTNSCNEIK